MQPRILERAKFNLQYDRRPDEHLEVRVATWNIGSLRRKGSGEACEEVREDD